MESPVRAARQLYGVNKDAKTWLLCYHCQVDSEVTMDPLSSEFCCERLIIIVCPSIYAQTFLGACQSFTRYWRASHQTWSHLSYNCFCCPCLLLPDKIPHLFSIFFYSFSWLCFSYILPPHRREFLLWPTMFYSVIGQLSIISLPLPCEPPHCSAPLAAAMQGGENSLSATWKFLPNWPSWVISMPHPTEFAV